MKKHEQEMTNEYCFNQYNAFMERKQRELLIKSERLNNCQAVVYETHNYIYLKSYNTIVAFIDKDWNELFDVLRMVYGYTATSAQHITKFKNKYSHCFDTAYTYRDI